MTAKDSVNQPGQRIVVTGIGVVSPVGHDTRSTWDALVGGKSGIAPITRFDPTGYQTTFAGEVKDFDPVARMGRTRGEPIATPISRSRRRWRHLNRRV